MRQDVALIACLFFSFWWVERQGREKNEVFTFTDGNETDINETLNNVSENNNFYQRPVVCSSFKSMYGGPWYGRWKNSRFSYKCFIVL